MICIKMSATDLLKKLAMRIGPDMAKMADSLINPKILADADGNVTVSAAELQHVYELLRFTASELDDLAYLARVLVRNHAANRPYSAFDIIRISRRAPSAAKELKNAIGKLEEALPFKDNTVIGKNKLKVEPCSTPEESACFARCLVFEQPMASAPASAPAPAPEVEEDLYA